MFYLVEAGHGFMQSIGFAQYYLGQTVHIVAHGSNVTHNLVFLGSDQIQRM